ncbi:tripartite tricarboxylate transporter TctB family protein [Microvirga sp. P5_D2]
MQRKLLAPKELWLGVIYFAFGALGLWFSLEYPMGTAARMGPGYLPALISGLLLLFGAISFTRAVRLHGEPISKITLRPLICILGGVLLFAYLVERAGLVVALLALILTGAAASHEFRFQWSATFGLIGFIAFCALVFVKGLGVPMPLIGTWFVN